jgi:hypothetical protein
MLLLTVCTARPHQYKVPKVVFRKKLADAIKHAELLCHGYEDTFECKNAWGHVRDLEFVLNRQEEEKKEAFSELEIREYDV